MHHTDQFNTAYINDSDVTTSCINLMDDSNLDIATGRMEKNVYNHTTMNNITNATTNTIIMNEDEYNSSGASMSVDDDHESVILSFCDITGCDIGNAKQFLEVRSYCSA